MMDDFAPIIRRFEGGRGRTLRIWAVADVHIGAREADVDGFAAFLKRVESDPDSYLVLVGDIVNNGIKDSLTNVYHETMPPSAQIEKAVELLAPVKDRILGAVGGNHERRTARHVDIDIGHTILTLLGIGDLYRPNMAFIRLFVDGSGKVSENYSLLLTHGSSDSRRRQFQYAVEGVDAVITAHTHNGIVERPARLCLTQQNRVVVKPLVSMVATSWLRYGGYAARGMLKPAATSCPQCLEVTFTNSNNSHGGMRVVW